MRIRNDVRKRENSYTNLLTGGWAGSLFAPKIVQHCRSFAKDTRINANATTSIVDQLWGEHSKLSAMCNPKRNRLICAATIHSYQGQRQSKDQKKNKKKTVYRDSLTAPKPNMEEYDNDDDSWNEAPQELQLNLIATRYIHGDIGRKAPWKAKRTKRQ